MQGMLDKMKQKQHSISDKGGFEPTTCVAGNESLCASKTIADVAQEHAAALAQDGNQS